MSISPQLLHCSMFTSKHFVLIRQCLRGHTFMTSTRRSRGVRLRLTHVDGGAEGQLHIDVHTQNRVKSSCLHLMQRSSCFCTKIFFLDTIKSGKFSSV